MLDESFFNFGDVRNIFDLVFFSEALLIIKSIIIIQIQKIIELKNKFYDFVVKENARNHLTL